MTKTIEQMTITEIAALIRKKRRLAKQTPKLRKERAKILERVEQIDKLLTTAGPVRGQRLQKKALVKVKAKKRGRTAASQILEFLSERAGVPSKATEIADAMKLNINTVRPTLSKLARSGKVEAGQSMYWMGGKKAATKKTETRESTTAPKGGKSVKQRILDFLGKSKDLHKTAEIRKALPGVRSQYIYNVLGKLKKDGAIVHENGTWGIRLPF